MSVRWRRRAGRWRSGVAAVEFAIVGGVFITVVLLLLETGWQMTLDIALQYAARSASRFGVTGQTVPPGMTPPPPDRPTAIVDLAVSSVGGLLNPAQLTVTETSYASFAAAAANTGGAAGPGSGGQVVVYSFTYTQPFFTPLAAAIARRSTWVHVAKVTVLNEPFPAS